MTLADIKGSIFFRTKTNATSFAAADMVIGINNALERVNSIIRTYLSNYDVTRYTTSDLSTGTEVPKFRSLFHSLIALWTSYEYAVANGYPNAIQFLQEIQLIEQQMKDWYGARNYRIFTVTLASPGVFTLKKHGLISGTKVIFETTGALPTGLSAETWYYVITSGLTEDTFQVAATKDGTAINTSVSQSGTHYVGTDTAPRLASARHSSK